MLTVLKSETEISKISKLTRGTQGNGQLATDSQGRKWMSSCDPRTFHQTRGTVTDTTSNVKGVLTNGCLQENKCHLNFNNYLES